MYKAGSLLTMNMSGFVEWKRTNLDAFVLQLVTGTFSDPNPDPTPIFSISTSPQVQGRFFPFKTAKGTEIGRASCRERVCLAV